jgi:hypothetical protein
VKISGNAIRLPSAYALNTKKSKFLSVKKFQQKISHVYLRNPCAFIKYREKRSFHLIGVKKDKTCIVQSLIFSTEFFHFYLNQTASHFFVKRLDAYVTCKDVRDDFSFFYIENVSNIAFK